MNRKVSSQFVKYGFLIVSVSICVYTQDICTNSDVCNAICTSNWYTNCVKLCNKCNMTRHDWINEVCTFRHVTGCHDSGKYCSKFCQSTVAMTYSNRSPGGIRSTLSQTTSTTTIEKGPEREGKDGDKEGKSSDHDDKNNSKATNTAIGAVIPVIILVIIVLVIWYCMSKKSRHITKPESMSNNVFNFTDENTEEVHENKIAVSIHEHTEAHDDLEYTTIPDLYNAIENKLERCGVSKLPSEVKVSPNADTNLNGSYLSPISSTLHEPSTNENEYTYIDQGHVQEPTEGMEGSTDTSEYYTLESEQGTERTELASAGVNVKGGTNTENENKKSNSEYTCLQVNEREVSTTTTGTEDGEGYEYTYPSFPDGRQEQSKSVEYEEIPDLSEHHQQKNNQNSDITSLHNDKTYAELMNQEKDSNDDIYNTLNRLPCNVPDDLANDYVSSYDYDEESEHYSHFNRSFDMDKNVVDSDYGQLEFPTNLGPVQNQLSIL